VIAKVVLAGLVALGLGLALSRYHDMQGLDNFTFARRLLESRGIVCAPKIVERSEGELHVVCADGKHDFIQPLVCGTASPILCDVLGFDAACWEHVPDHGGSARPRCAAAGPGSP
jgi:hypothetical protein